MRKTAYRDAMHPLLRRAVLVLRRSIAVCWSLSWWTTAGLRDRRTRPTGMRLLVLGLLVGALVGWSNGKIIHVIQEKELPRPVTPPPAGATWARVMTTGYCPCWRCCGLEANGHTSINRDVSTHPFGLASDPGMMPYHTELQIPGYGQAEVDDTGGRMRQDARKDLFHLDLRFVTHEEAQRWGVRWMWIAVPRDSKAAALAP